MLSHLAKEALLGIVALGGATLLYKRFKHGPSPSPSPGPSPQPGAPPASTQHATPPPGGFITGSQPGDTYGVVTTAGSPDTSTDTSAYQASEAGFDTSSSDDSSASDALSALATAATAF